MILLYYREFIVFGLHYNNMIITQSASAIKLME